MSMAASFPLHMFLRKNFDSESHMDKVQAILQTNPKDRTHADCVFLVDVLSNIEFFKKANRSLCMEIARVATYVGAARDETIFRQGTVGTTFYVILSGSVSVRVQDMMKPDDIGYEAAVLIAGKSFGELALHSENAVRAASIIAIEDCGFLVVEKADYDRILKRSLDGEAQEKFDFCSELPFLSGCSMRELQRLSAIMGKKKFESNSLIFSQNEDSNNVYFILSGEVRVVQCIEIKYPDEQEHHLNFDNLSDDDIDDVDDGDALSTQRRTSSTAATTFKGQHVPSLKLPGPSALKSPQSQPSSSSSTFSSAAEDANTSRKSARKGGVTIRLPGDEDVNEADSIQTSKSHHQPIPQSSLTSSSSSIPKLRLDRLSGGSNIASKASASSYFHVMNDSTSVASEKSLKQHSLKAASKFSHPNSSRNAQELKLPKINKYPSSSASSAQTARNSTFRNQHSASASSSIPPSTRYHSTRNIRHSSADSARSDVSTPSMLSARSKLMKSFRERNAPSRPTHQLVDLGELGPKQYFGELGVLLDKPRSASVFAKTRVEVLHISKGDFLSRMPESALDYFRQFSKYYPSYDAIMAMINRQQKWDSFKDKLVDQTLREYRR